MNAQEAINKIKAAKTVFMGIEVNAHNYAIETRDRLQEMAEKAILSPIEYWIALRLTWPQMSDSEKRAELENI